MNKEKIIQRILFGIGIPLVTWGLILSSSLSSSDKLISFIPIWIGVVLISMSSILEDKT